MGGHIQTPLHKHIKISEVISCTVLFKGEEKTVNFTHSPAQENNSQMHKNGAMDGGSAE